MSAFSNQKMPEIKFLGRGVRFDQQDQRLDNTRGMRSRTKVGGHHEDEPHPEGNGQPLFVRAQYASGSHRQGVGVLEGRSEPGAPIPQLQKRPLFRQGGLALGFHFFRGRVEVPWGTGDPLRHRDLAVRHNAVADALDLQAQPKDVSLLSR